MVMPVPTSQAPSVVTGSQAGLWQALASGMPQQSQAAVQQQLAVMARRQGNYAYMKACILKKAPALTNGAPTQAFQNSQPFTFNLPQPNGAFARGIIVRTTLAYTLATGTGATYGLTAAGPLAIYDTIEIKYNKSQIKFRPLWLRHLALAGGMKQFSMPTIASTDGGGQSDAALASYLSPTMPTATGAQTYQQDLWIPFNWLSPYETRGLLPAMPGETGIQVVLTAASSIFGPDPVFNCIYGTGGTGNAVSAVSGTMKVIMIYSDGEVYNQPAALPYDMTVLNGTVQVQQDNQLTGLIAGSANVNRGQLNILGQHYYVGLLVVDGNQSNSYSTDANILYISSDKDSIGANSFWKYGQGTNLDVQEYWSEERFIHNNHDMDPGVFWMVEAPLKGDRTWGMATDGATDFSQYLDNTVAGWPAWHYGFSFTSLNTLGTVPPRVEPFCIFVNPVGLPPVGL
jgi:hypothetical protein